jgi:two-component system CheB/CheR fusion protein
MARLVGDLLDVSRISRGKIELQRDCVDLSEVVDRTVDDHRGLFSTRGIALALARPEERVWVQGDAVRLAQTLGNLLQNAAKFTPAGGQVGVELRRERNLAVLRVRDTGIGIAPDMLERIFQPFTQADRTLDRGAGGLGIGLALVKGIVELHGGQVAAASAGPGKGAELTIRLAAREPPQAERRPEPPPRAAAGRRVLVIEDSVDAAESLKEALELDDYLVEIAFDGPEGLAKAHSFAPDVVLCDIGLPGMDGYGVARAMRDDQALCGVALVALSGYAQVEDQEKARQAGFDRHLAKPPDLATLERILSELSAQHRAQ